MGFGLLWTPLVRRLSAVALFIIFNAAVYPFGRIDLGGHALIMAIIVAIAVDPERELHFLPAIRKSLAGVPVALAAALIVFVTSYWGVHLAFYGTSTAGPASAIAIATHTFDPENPHAAPGNAGAASSANVRPVTGAALAEYQAAMETMHSPMVEGFQDPDADVAFVRSMIPHHQGAIDMARIQLKYGTDPNNRALAQHIIDELEIEIRQMEQWLKARSDASGDK